LRYLDTLSKEELVKYAELLSKNLLTLDGYWFLGIEDRLGIEAAIDMDRQAWEKYGVSEARRLKAFLNITEGSLEDLEKAVQLLAYAPASDLTVDRTPKRLVLTFRSCRPQSARARSGRGEFACKPVGMAHLSAFAKEINPRFKLKCLYCPPDERPPGSWCSWEFSLD